MDHTKLIDNGEYDDDYDDYDYEKLIMLIVI